MSIENKNIFETIEGIHALLSNIHHIRNAAIYKNDLNAINLLIDLDNTMRKIDLTAKQKKVIHLVFEKGLTQCETARYMNITQQAVQKSLWKVINLIVIVYKNNSIQVLGRKK